MPIGVAATVREGDDRRAIIEPSQCGEHLVYQKRVLVPIPAVQEDEQWPSSIVLGSFGNHHADRELLADSIAVDRDLRCLRPVLIRPDEIASRANREPHGDADGHNGRERQEAAPPIGPFSC